MSSGKGVYVCAIGLCLCLLLFVVDNCDAAKRTKNKKKESGTHLWTTQIVIQVNQTSRDVYVRFRLAPKEYKFKRYSFLLEYANRTLVRRYKPYKPTTDELRNGKAAKIIKQLNPGKYVILIEPVDDRRGNPIECLCKKENGACTYCSATYSDVFSVNYQSDHVSSVSEPSRPRPIPGSGQWNLSTTILIVGVILLTLGLLALLGYIKFRKTRRRPIEDSEFSSTFVQPNNVNEKDVKPPQRVKSEKQVTVESVYPPIDLSSLSIETLDKFNSKENEEVWTDASKVAGELNRIQLGPVDDRSSQMDGLPHHPSSETSSGEASQMQETTSLLRPPLRTCDQRPSQLDGLQHGAHGAADQDPELTRLLETAVSLGVHGSLHSSSTHGQSGETDIKTVVG